MTEKEQTVVAEGLLSVPEAMRFLSISRTTLYDLMDAGKLVYSKIGRSRRIPRRALVELAAAGSKAAETPTRVRSIPMEWQWESIRDDAFIDVEQIIETFVGNKLSAPERWQLTTAFLDLADQLEPRQREQESRCPWRDVSPSRHPLPAQDAACPASPGVAAARVTRSFNAP